MKPRHREGLELAMQIARESGRPIDTGQPKTDPEAYRDAYGGRPLTDDECAFVADPVRSVPDSVDVYFQPVHWSLVDVPITYLVNEHDRPTPRELQLEMAGRLPEPPAVHHLDSGHVPAVTDPRLSRRADRGRHRGLTQASGARMRPRGRHGTARRSSQPAPRSVLWNAATIALNSRATTSGSPSRNEPSRWPARNMSRCSCMASAYRSATSASSFVSRSPRTTADVWRYSVRSSDASRKKFTW